MKEIVVDSETTCLSLRDGHRIVEIGCIELDNLVLNDPSVVNFSATIDPVSCSGASDGSISVAISGGVFPYDFLWPELNSNSLTVDNLPLGDYNFQVTDANGCQETLSHTINALT